MKVLISPQSITKCSSIVSLSVEVVKTLISPYGTVRYDKGEKKEKKKRRPKKKNGKIIREGKKKPYPIVKNLKTCNTYTQKEKWDGKTKKREEKKIK